MADLSFSTFVFTSLTTLTTSSATFLAYEWKRDFSKFHYYSTQQHETLTYIKTSLWYMYWYHFFAESAFHVIKRMTTNQVKVSFCRKNIKHDYKSNKAPNIPTFWFLTWVSVLYLERSVVSLEILATSTVLVCTSSFTCLLNVSAVPCKSKENQCQNGNWFSLVEYIKKYKVMSEWIKIWFDVCILSIIDQF